MFPVTYTGKKTGLFGITISLSNPESDIDDPWTLPPSRKRTKKLEGPFPEEVNIVKANQIFIKKEGLSSQLITHLKRIAAFQNPEFYRQQAMRLSVYNKPRIISCSEDYGKYIALPRGCFDEIQFLFDKCNIKVNVQDKRFDGKEINIKFKGELRDSQKKAVKKLLDYETGILAAGTAFGKTVVAIKLIASRRRNTLILVHRKQLMDQWKEKLTLFLDAPSDPIGTIGSGKKKPTEIIDIAMMQSLVKQGTVSDLVASYGQIIVDECHHVSAFSFESILKEAKAKYIVGLTATPKRKDGHHPIIVMQCGAIRYRVSDQEQAKTRQFEHIVNERKTGFMMQEDEDSYQINDVYAALLEDQDRNRLILEDIISSLEQNRSPLLLTERTAHLEYFKKEFEKLPYETIVLKGGMGKKQRQKAVLALSKPTDKQVIIATGKYIGEGFDNSKLDTLFLAMPISWTGTLQQYVGRLHRLYDQKKVVKVYDYSDLKVPMLARMFKKRLKGYKAIGYRLVDSQQQSIFDKDL